MNKFAFATPRSYEEAGALLKDSRFKLPVLKSGGLDVVDHLKEGLYEADALINIRRLRVQGSPEPISATVKGDAGVWIAATATLAEIAASPVVMEKAPVVAQAVHSAATPQVRNVATAAGNLLQRPRCWYYRQYQFDCLKKGGDRCFAVEGENKFHAIFGDGPCHIVHPSNLAPALSVCEGMVHVTGGHRERIPIADLFHMPDKGVKSENTLEPGEIVTHITVKEAPKSGFYAIKEKQSFDWPMVLACVALDMDGETIKAARVCAGAVAPIPWRLPAVEKALAGVNMGDDAALRKAAAASGDNAKPMRDNSYKVKLLAVAVRRAVLRAAGKDPEPVA